MSRRIERHATEFPDWHILFEPIHEGRNEGEGFGAVFGVNAHNDGGFANRYYADAMNDDCSGTRVGSGEFEDDAADGVFRHRLVGLVL